MENFVSVSIGILIVIDSFNLFAQWFKKCKYEETEFYTFFSKLSIWNYSLIREIIIRTTENLKILIDFLERVINVILTKSLNQLLNNNNLRLRIDFIKSRIEQIKIVTN